MKAFIIDDDHLSIYLTQSILKLEDEALEINTYLSAPEALEVLQNASDAELPELIFLDLNMPLLDGWELLDALAPMAERLQHNCSIYILTSSLDISDTEKANSYPMVTGLLHKPIMSEDVQIILSNLTLQNQE